MQLRSVLHHVSYGVADLARSSAFYDAVAPALGCVRLWSDARAVGYGPAGGDDVLAIKAERFAPCTHGERSHLAFAAQTRAAVHAFWAAALSAGGTDEGAPGLCPEYGSGYYAAFVRDPDGYRLEAVCRDVDAAPGQTPWLAAGSAP